MQTLKDQKDSIEEFRLNADSIVLKLQVPIPPASFCRHLNFGATLAELNCITEEIFKIPVQFEMRHPK